VVILAMNKALREVMFGANNLIQMMRLGRGIMRSYITFHVNNGNLKIFHCREIEA
jgi:hypothetical protein